MEKLLKVKNTQGREFFYATSSQPLLLNCNWVGFVDEESSAKIACESITKAIKEHGFKGILNDNRQQTGPWPKLDEWLGTVWIPSMGDAGLRYFAHIHSESIFTEMSAKKILKEKYGSIEFGHFKSEEDALDWLAEKIPNLKISK